MCAGVSPSACRRLIASHLCIVLPQTPHCVCMLSGCCSLSLSVMWASPNMCPCGACSGDQVSISATVNYGQKDFCFKGLQTPVQGWFEGMEDGLIWTSAVCHPSQGLFAACQADACGNLSEGRFSCRSSVSLAENVHCINRTLSVGPQQDIHIYMNTYKN